jgi:hypothetical protein
VITIARHSPISPTLDELGTTSSNGISPACDPGVQPDKNTQFTAQVARGFRWVESTIH